MRSGFRIPRLASLCLCAVIAAAAAFVFHRYWLEGDRFAGNFDRLSGGSLPLRVWEARNLQQHGQIPAWSDNFLMGVNVGALGGMQVGWSPLAWLYAQTSPAGFLSLAAAVTVACWCLACLGAGTALRRLGAGLIPATVGALCYGSSALVTVRLAQSEALTYNFVLTPWLVCLLAPAPARRPGLVVAALGVLMFVLFNYSLLQETAYLGIALAGFAAWSGWRQRSWRPLAWLGVATICAAVAAAPRVVKVQHDLALLQRSPSGAPGEVVTFESSYAQQNLTTREFLRFFADGIFGRFPAEARAIGNNINLNEGFQVYSSTFASLLVLVALGLACRREPSPPDHGLPRSLAVGAGGFVLTVSVLVLTKGGMHLLHRLFLGIDFSHGRMVAAILLPLAMLVAYALDRLGNRIRPAPWSWRIGIFVPAAALALLTHLGVARLITQPRDPARIDLATPLPRLLSAPFRLLSGRPWPVEPPRGGLARWLRPGVAGLAWENPADAIVEVEMQVDDGPFTVMGRNEANRYTIGDIAPDGPYRFRLRAWRGKNASDYSAPFAIQPLAPDTAFDALAPASSQGARTWLLSREVIHVGAAVLVGGLWLLLLAALGKAPVPRAFLVHFMAVLVIAESLSGITTRLSGEQTRTFPRPFADDNLFTSPPGTLDLPAAGARKILQDRLERDRYRTLLLEPGDQFYSTTLHVPMAWDLRVLQGAWSGIPRRLAALPWPANVVSMRRLIFRPDTDLPWDLLGKLNVKYVLTVETELYFNLTPPGAATGSPPSNLHIMENPGPVLPREFFVSRTVPTAAFKERSEFPIPLPSDPREESAVEGMAEARAWNSEGSIKAAYAGDEVRLTLEASTAPRFLVLNELYHPDWQASTPTGAILRIYPVNTVMRGLEIPPGTTQVILSFRPPPGPMWQTLAGLVGAGGLLLASLQAERRRGHAPAAAR